MKKGIFKLLFLLPFSLALCACTETTQTALDIDYNSIVNKIYSEVQEEVGDRLYSEVYSNVMEELTEGTLDTDSLQNLIKATVKTAQNTNVLVSTYVTSNNEQVTSATGSGVVYLKENNSEGSSKLYKYYVITNQHVVEDGTSFSISFDGEENISCTNLGEDSSTDLALLMFESNNTYPVATLGDASSVEPGDIVIACGNPKGSSLFNSVTLGICGGVDRCLQDSEGTINTRNKYIQHDAAINPGNSGGGLYNLDGELIGINSVKYASSEIEGLNFAIPVQLVSEVIGEIKEYGSYSGTVSLGITSIDINKLTLLGRLNYNVPDEITRGLLIISVSETGSCYNILKTNDIIVEADGITITGSNSLQPVLNSHKVGDTITIKVIRNGEVVSVNVTFLRTK